MKNILLLILIMLVTLSSYVCATPAGSNNTIKTNYISTSQLYYYAFGDSITMATTYDSLDDTGYDCYILDMTRRYNPSVLADHNMDGSGQPSSWGISNFATHPDSTPIYYFIMFGVNDRARDESYTAEETADNLISIYNMAAANGSRPYILLEPAATDVGDWSTLAYQQDNMTKIQNRLSSFGYSYIKTYDAVDLIPGNGQLDGVNPTFAEGVHPNVEGHRAMADYIWTAISSGNLMVSFTGNITSGTTPLTVKFTDTSTGSPTSWFWSFGDGSMENATVQNPVHTFVTPGLYDVSLTATNIAGSNSNTKMGFIAVTSAAVTPVAEFSAIPPEGVAPLTVKFTDTSINTPTEWSWSFRNLTPGNNTQIWFSTSQNPTHTFGIGNYSIVLRASNSEGYDLSAQDMFINVTTATIAPVASFNPSGTSGTSPFAVTFTDTSTNTPTEWSWSFRNITPGNNTQIWFSTSQNPTHTFGIGNYSLVLNASNSAGYALSTQTTFINVTTTPVNITSKIGIYRNGVFYLRNSNTAGNADLFFGYGTYGDTPLIGDWNGDGIDTAGIYRNGVFYLRNSNTAGNADIVFIYGILGDTPLVGDWDGSGNDTVGIYRNGGFYLHNSNRYGIADLSFIYGQPRDVPVIGDWTGSGKDTIGVYRNSIFYLRNSNTNGIADLTFNYGQPGDVPVIGNWAGT